MRSRNRKRMSWGRQDAVERAIFRIKRNDSNVSHLLVVSYGALDTIKLYRSSSYNDAMSEMVQAVSRIIEEHVSTKNLFNKIYKFKITKVRSRFSLKLIRKLSSKSKDYYFLVIVKVDESYVGYRFEDLIDSIASNAVDDMLSEN